MSSTSDNAPGRDGNFAHPTATLLADFAHGRLDEADLAQVETHLESCPACCRSLAKLSQQSDRFVEELVSAATPGDAASSTVPDGAGQSKSTPHSDLLGPPARTIGRFVVRAEIGHGGFGVVLLASDPQLRREVAVKIPRLGSFLTAELRERFLREAQAAAALDHPNIVPIHESGEADGVCYIVSSYCRGTNLAAWLKATTQPVGFATAAGLVADLADAVEHAHARGVLHRDLKPSNVLLETPAPPLPPADVQTSPPKHPRDETLHPRITDFGLAKLDGDGPDTTRSNVVMGTVGYMSPEQARGKTKEITAATDIYSLGAILYELLAGRPPFVGDSDLETLHRVQDEEPIPPARLRPRLPRDLETISLTCLQKHPRRRYESARSLADDLRRFLEGQAIRARPTSRAERLVRWCRRKPALAALSACVMLLLTALLVGSVVSSVWFHEQQQTTLVQLEETKRAEQLAAMAGERAVREEQAAKRELFASLLAAARARRLAARSGQKFNSLEALHEAASLAQSLNLGAEDRLRLRNEVIACLPLVDVRIDRTWPAYPPGSARTGIAFDADIERYAKIDADGRMVVRRIEDNAELFRADVDAPQSRPPVWWLLMRFSPDGNYLAARGQYVAANPRRMVSTRVWDVRGGELAIEPLPPSGDNEVLDFDFSPDSRTFAVGHADGSVRLVDLASGDSRTLLPQGTSPRMLRYDPSGARLAVCLATGTQIVDVEAGDVALTLATPSHVAAWSSDGERLATATSSTATVWESRSGAPVADFKGHQNEIVSIDFLPDSTTLATTSWADTRLWNAVSGRQMLLVESGNATCFSRDRRWLGLGFSGSEVGRFEVAVPNGFRTLGERVEPYHGLDISADGRLLLAVDRGRLLLWDVPSGRLVGIMTLPRSGDRLHAGFDASGANLWTNSQAGLQRWPIQWDLPRRAELRDHADEVAQTNLTARLVIGPPQPIRLSPPMNVNGFFRGGHGRLLLADNHEVRVVDVSPADAKTLGRVRHAGWWMAASNDGRWLATSQWHGYGTRVWDLQTGHRIHTIAGVNATVAFSPNSNYLVVGDPGRYEIYETGSWNLARTIDSVDMGVGRPISFSRDGNVLAISTSHSKINLLDGQTFEELASFVAPSMERLTEMRLSPTAKQLVAKTASGVTHIWDLQRVRESLAPMGLDWRLSAPVDAGRTPDSSAAAAVAKGQLKWLDRVANFELHVDLGKMGAEEELSEPMAQSPSKILHRKGEFLVQRGQWNEAVAALDEAVTLPADDWDLSATLTLRGVAHYRLGHYTAALADGERALDLDPEHYLRSLALAWALATCPDEGLRDAERAAELACRSIDLYRQNAKAWLTLGVAYYRQSRFDDAVAAIDESMQLGDGGNSYDWFALAMVHARQGNLDEARHWYDKAEQWMKSRQKQDPELSRLHAEAHRLVTAISR